MFVLFFIIIVGPVIAKKVGAFNGLDTSNLLSNFELFQPTGLWNNDTSNKVTGTAVAGGAATASAAPGGGASSAAGNNGGNNNGGGGGGGGATASNAFSFSFTKRSLPTPAFAYDFAAADVVVA